MDHNVSGFADSHDELKADNEVLKLRLEMEHGMQEYRCNNVNPELENRWLKYIYQHEELLKNCGRIKVYDYIGRPLYTPIEELKAEDVSIELIRLRSIMWNFGVQLDCLCAYDDSVIYKFLTTELFAEEMDDVRMPGLVNHFTYEEYHMNDPYEIQGICKRLIKSIYNHDWRPEYDALWLTDKVWCNGVELEYEEFNSLILEFQQRHAYVEVKELHVEEPKLNETGTSAALKITMDWVSQLHSETEQASLKDECSFLCDKDSETGYWHIASITVPGLAAVAR